MCDRPLFSVGSRTYSRIDAIAAASLRGEWSSLEAQARLELACAKRAESEDEPPDIDLSKIVEAFRYERQLLTVEETEQWLERAGLTLETLSDQMERTELSRLWSDEAEDILRSHTVTDEELAEAMYPALVCSGALERFTSTLADHAAAREESAPGAHTDEAAPDEAAARDALRAVNLACGSRGAVGDSKADWQQRVAGLQGLERVFQRLVGIELTPAAMQARVDAHRLDWILVAWRAIGFASEGAAREAALRMRTDRESFEAVSADLGLTASEQQSLLGAVDDPLRAPMLSARVGELIGPVAAGDQFWLVSLDQKVAPTLANPEVRRHAEADVASAFVERCRKHIRWHEQPS